MTRVVLPVTLVLAFALPSMHARQDPQQPLEDIPVFRSTTEFVSVPVTVTDRRGRAVNDLKQDDFILQENGVPQRIESFLTVQEASNIGIGIGLVIDVSGSMVFEDGIDAMRLGVDRLMKRIKKEDEIYLLEFANSPILTVPWTSDRRPILNRIRQVKTRPGSGVWDAMMAALPISVAGEQKKQVILVFTDGGSDSVSRATAAQVSRAAQMTDVVIYAFVVVRDDSTFLRNTAQQRQMTGEIERVTNPTGGRTFFVQGFGALEDELDRLGREVTSQYFLEYQRRGENDGKYREIVVQVKDRPELTVQHRRGYLAN